MRAARSLLGVRLVHETVDKREVAGLLLRPRDLPEPLRRALSAPPRLRGVREERRQSRGERLGRSRCEAPQVPEGRSNG